MCLTIPPWPKSRGQKFPSGGRRVQYDDEPDLKNYKVSLTIKITRMVIVRHLFGVPTQNVRCANLGREWERWLLTPAMVVVCR